jgi:hypothetical protein
VVALDLELLPAAGLVFLFAALDLFAMHWIAIPYYTVLTAHRPNSDALTAFHFNAYRALGFGEIFERLAVNKWAPISPGVLAAHWALYVVSTMLLVAICIALARRRERVDRF